MKFALRLEFKSTNNEEIYRANFTYDDGAGGKAFYPDVSFRTRGNTSRNFPEDTINRIKNIWDCGSNPQ